jgi:ribonucleotide reductase beta subunit family protein with ferritin-like domain
MEFIESVVCDKDDLVSLGAFSMVEGAVLYSSFAFLKHFQTEGNKKLNNVCRGIDFSVRDENIHCIGGAWLFQQLLTERVQAGLLSPEQLHTIREKLKAVALKIAEHEHKIVDMIFEKGDMKGITKEDLKTFIMSRVNVCLSHLDIQPIFPVSADNPIAIWYYKNINGIQFHDFFAGVGNSYKRTWKETGFKWQIR